MCDFGIYTSWRPLLLDLPLRGSSSNGTVKLRNAIMSWRAVLQELPRSSSAISYSRSFPSRLSLLRLILH